MVSKSSSGGGKGPFFLRLTLFELGLSTEVEDALSCFTLAREPFRLPCDLERELLCNWVDGKTSFFCLEAGNISSRSTGTPRDTRNNRRIRERTQLGGCKGGGATSWDQSERLRSVRKIEPWLTMGFGEDWGSLVVGNSSSRYGLVTSIMFSKVSRSLKSSKSLSIFIHQQHSNLSKGP